MRHGECLVKHDLEDLHKFVLFHLMEKILFDLPHTVYINILLTMKTLKGLDDIYYVSLINKLIWEHQVYHVFERMDEELKHSSQTFW